MQGSGIGGALLGAAERHAASVMGAQTAVLWVISSRADILDWYERRRGYTRTEQTAPFPGAEANVGTPLSGGIEFVRLEKRLAGGWDALRGEAGR